MGLLYVPAGYPSQYCLSWQNKSALMCIHFDEKCLLECLPKTIVVLCFWFDTCMFCESVHCFWSSDLGNGKGKNVNVDLSFEPHHFQKNQKHTYKHPKKTTYDSKKGTHVVFRCMQSQKTKAAYDKTPPPVQCV